MTERLYSIADLTSAQAVERLLGVLLPDATTVLDTTYGSGSFWRGSQADVMVTGLDINPSRAKHVCADFTALPFAEGSFDVVVFDPPYHTDVGRQGSVTHARFGSFATLSDLRPAVERGTAEAWRVARLGIIVKVQDHIHAARAHWLSRWVWDALPVEPYDSVILARRQKITDPKWTRQLSVWRNHATFWVFRKDGPVSNAPTHWSGFVSRPRGVNARRSVRMLGTGQSIPVEPQRPRRPAPTKQARQPAPKQSEKQWMATVLEWAALRGWRACDQRGACGKIEAASCPGRVRARRGDTWRVDPDASAVYPRPPRGSVLGEGRQERPTSRRLAGHWPLLGLDRVHRQGGLRSYQLGRPGRRHWVLSPRFARLGWHPGSSGIRPRSSLSSPPLLPARSSRSGAASAERPSRRERDGRPAQVRPVCSGSRGDR